MRDLVRIADILTREFANPTWKYYHSTEVLLVLVVSYTGQAFYSNVAYRYETTGLHHGTQLS
jgi:hypothetical protein